MPIDVQESAPWNTVKPNIGLLRRASGFSLASVAASLPGSVASRTKQVDPNEEGRQMIEVPSRPGSVREPLSDEDAYAYESSGSDEDGSASDLAGDGEIARVGYKSDVKSIRSFSSLMSGASRERRERKTLADRLASVSGIERGHPTSSSKVGAIHTRIRPIDVPNRIRLRPLGQHRLFSLRRQINYSLLPLRYQNRR